MRVASKRGRAVIRRSARLVLRMIRNHPWPMIVAIAGAAVYSIGLVVGSFVVGRVIDDIVIPDLAGATTSLATVLVAGAVIVGVSVIRSIGVVFRRYFGSMNAKRNQVLLRRSLTDHYLDAPLEVLRRRPTGTLLAHADNDVDIATEAINPLPFATSVLVLVGVALGALLAVDVYLTLVGLVMFPALAWINRRYTQRVVVPAMAVQERLGRVSALAHESFDGALVVKTLGRERAEVGRMAAVSAQLRDARTEVGRLRAFFDPWMDFLPDAGAIALVAVGAWRVSEDAMTAGDLVAAMVLFSVLALPVRVIGFFLEEIPRSVVALDRIDAVLADAPTGREDPPHSSSTSLPAGPLEVELTDVSFAYDQVPVLDGLGFELAAGERVALVGATGSGKTTICLLLDRLLVPSAGRILVGGRPLEDLAPTELAARVAVVFQESFLFAASVADNITLEDPAIDERAMVAAADAARASSFIEELASGYRTEVGERGITLSGGQRQRIALARALVRQPDLLVLDDATAAVDPVIEGEILDGLRATQTTTLIVAHRLSTIELADRVLYLDGGRIAASGSHRELLALPGYAALARAYEETAA